MLRYLAVAVVHFVVIGFTYSLLLGNSEAACLFAGVVSVLIAVGYWLNERCPSHS